MLEAKWIVLPAVDYNGKHPKHNIKPSQIIGFHNSSNISLAPSWVLLKIRNFLGSQSKIAFDLYRNRNLCILNANRSSTCSTCILICLRIFSTKEHLPVDEQNAKYKNPKQFWKSSSEICWSEGDRWMVNGEDLQFAVANFRSDVRM